MTQERIMELVDEYAYRQEDVAQTTGSITPRGRVRAAVVAAIEQLTKDAACTWTQDPDFEMGDTWDSSCGEKWSFVDGGPEQNRVRYCHACGGKVGIAAQKGEAQIDGWADAAVHEVAAWDALTPEQQSESRQQELDAAMKEQQ